MSRIGSLVYWGLSHIGLPTLMLRRVQGAAVFTFHNVVPDEHRGRGDASLHLGCSEFSDYLDWIAGKFEVVHAIEIVNRLLQKESVAGLAALTFDDAYQGVVEWAVPTMAKRRLPATLFVVSDAATQPGTFWWDEVGEAGRLDVTTRNRCLYELAGDADRIRSALQCSGEDLPKEFRSASWDSLRGIAGDAIDFGAHTATHSNLVALPEEGLHHELAGSRERIQRELDSPARLVAYPYGLVNDEIRGKAANEGFLGGVGMHRGPVTSHSDCLQLPRINIPSGITMDALFCRTAGLRLR